MKRSSSVSIGGIAFQMEQDAAEQLQGYIESLSQRYGDDSVGEEIVEDVEARIAELLLSQIGDVNMVVTMAQVDDAISQMGSPDSFEEDEPQVREYKGHTSKKAVEKRLYRNMEGAKLGGVLSGIACYSGSDVVWLRIAAVVAPIIAAYCGEPEVIGAIILAYMVLWMSIPAAKTASQKLQMRGAKVTTDSLASTLKDELSQITSSKSGSRLATVIADLAYAIGRLIRFALIVLVSVASVAVVLSIIAILSGFGYLFFDGWEIMTMLSSSPLPALISAVVALLAPLSLLLYVMIKMLVGLSWNRYIVASLTTLWIVATCFSINFFGSHLVWGNMNSGYSQEMVVANVDTLYIEPMGDIEATRGNDLFKAHIVSIETDVNFNQSVDSLFKIKFDSKAGGPTPADAQYNAEQVKVDFKLESNKLYFNPYIAIPSEIGYRKQECDMTIYVPKGGAVIISDKFRGYDIIKEYREYKEDLLD